MGQAKPQLHVDIGRKQPDITQHSEGHHNTLTVKTGNTSEPPLHALQALIVSPTKDVENPLLHNKVQLFSAARKWITSPDQLRNLVLSVWA